MKKQLFATPVITLLSFLFVISTVFAEEEIAPFFFDGCSAIAPEGTPEDPNLWCDCCLLHDIKYWKGGTWIDRRNADFELQSCVAEQSGSEALGAIFNLFVRFGGAPFYDTTYRWGYGWEFGRGYKSLTTIEEEDAAAKLEEWYVENPDICYDFN